MQPAHTDATNRIAPLSRRGLVTAAAAALIAAAACAPIEADLELGELGQTRGQILNENGLNLNGLNLNGLNLNGLNLNGVDYNALGYNGFGFDGSNYNGLNHAGLSANAAWQKWMTDAQYQLQASVFGYIVQCALEPGQTIAPITIQGQTFGPWEGVLGFAPDWYIAGNDVQTLDEQRQVSACLVAHANAIGAHVAISVLSEVIAPPSADEAAQYDRVEGHFFGNVFAESPYMAACHSANDPNAAGVTALAVSLRWCAAFQSACELPALPACDQVCANHDPVLGVYAECQGYPTAAVYLDVP